MLTISCYTLPFGSCYFELPQTCIIFFEPTLKPSVAFSPLNGMLSSLISIKSFPKQPRKYVNFAGYTISPGFWHFKLSNFTHFSIQSISPHCIDPKLLGRSLATSLSCKVIIASAFVSLNTWYSKLCEFQSEGLLKRQHCRNAMCQNCWRFTAQEILQQMYHEIHLWPP